MKPCMKPCMKRGLRRGVNEWEHASPPGRLDFVWRMQLDFMRQPSQATIASPGLANEAHMTLQSSIRASEDESRPALVVRHARASIACDAWNALQASRLQMAAVDAVHGPVPVRTGCAA